jgi:G3E family GTPase
MIGFTVIGGYLGAGKTTLLNHLLANNEGQRLAILINDFGAINIDAELVQSRSATRVTLTNGCICCSLADGFFEAIDQLTALADPPARIIVEASGVAEVHQLAQYGHLPGLRLDGVVVVTDAETVRGKAEDRYVGPTIRRQLAAADLLVLNKIDLIDADTIAAAEAWLSGVCPGVPVIKTCQSELPVEFLADWSVDRLDSANASPVLFPLPQDQGIHPAYSRWHLELTTVVSGERLERFCSALDESVIRLKGVTADTDGNGWIIQRVGRRNVLTPGSALAPGTRLIAIGMSAQFQASALEQLARSVFALNPPRSPK